MLESLLFLFTSIIGSVTIALMITSYRSNPFCNAFLLVIIMLISHRFLIQGSYGLGLQTLFKPDKGPNSIFYLIIAPCFYLYHKNLVNPEKKFNSKNLKHLIFIGLLYLLNIYFSNSFIFYFGKSTNAFLVAIFMVFYIVITYKVLSKKVWFRKNLLINNSHFLLMKNWTIYLFSFNVFAVFMLLISLNNEIINGSSLSGKSMAIPLLLFWLFIYFKILFTPEILYGIPILNKKILKFGLIEEASSTTNLSINYNWVLEVTEEKNNEQDLKLQEKINTNILSYIKEVDKLVSNNKIFRDPKISISDLAEKLGVPSSHLVYLFKYHSKISFQEYRMRERIKDGMDLIDNGYLKTNTMESLAYKIGFSSYNPFYIGFKKVTELSPHDFLKNKTCSI